MKIDGLTKGPSMQRDITVYNGDRQMLLHTQKTRKMLVCSLEAV